MVISLIMSRVSYGVATRHDGVYNSTTSEWSWLGKWFADMIWVYMCQNSLGPQQNGTIPMKKWPFQWIIGLFLLGPSFHVFARAQMSQGQSNCQLLEGQFLIASLSLCERWHSHLNSTKINIMRFSSKAGTEKDKDRNQKKIETARHSHGDTPRCPLWKSSLAPGLQVLVWW